MPRRRTSTLQIDLYADLGWLPRPPADFRERCRVLADADDLSGRDFARLAGFGLDENDLRRLARAMQRASRAGRSLDPLVPFTLAILGNGTLEPLRDAVVATGARHGLALTVVLAEYGQLLQTALDPNSSVNRSQPDAVLLAIDFEGLPFTAAPADSASARAGVEDALAFVGSLRRGLRENARALSIVQTLAVPAEPLFGSFDARVPGTARATARAFNSALAESLHFSDDVLLDVGALAETVGTARWLSPGHWNLAKLPFDPAFVGLYADHVCRLLAAIRGKSRRCLILDLDNTVWGGVVGDDGVDGIVVAQGDATGEAHLSVQRHALALRRRGIVLAVSSKNTDTVARAPFERHPEMLLRLEHFAVFQANWDDKATNIASIASALSLGTDAMVFLDDNPVERALVRGALPEVAVPELPEDPALFVRTLAAAGYFDTIAFSDEDRARAGLYADNARRVALQARVGDVPAYLASLDMQIVFKPFDATGRTRIAQLVNKSNQFNLTTKRLTESDVAELAADPSTFTLQVRLIDRFGDNGMIGVTVARPADERTWSIDLWLMSCRVLGRRVEEMVLREVILHARGRGIRDLVGTYVPTERNAMVADHYAKLGFTLVERSEDGTTRWRLPVSTEIEAAPMTVDRSAFSTP